VTIKEENWKRKDYKVDKDIKEARKKLNEEAVKVQELLKGLIRIGKRKKVEEK